MQNKDSTDSLKEAIHSPDRLVAGRWLDDLAPAHGPRLSIGSRVTVLATALHDSRSVAASSVAIDRLILDVRERIVMLV